MSNETRERRKCVELRMAMEGDAPRIEDGNYIVEGYAAKFNSPDGHEYFREQIAPGAFTDVLDNDVRFLINHDGAPLARTKSGTMTLTQDDIGLHVSARLAADDPDVQALVPKMTRGDMDQMSFAFDVADGGDEWDDRQDPALRTVHHVSELYDVSIVTYPFYEDTEIALRSRDAARGKSNLSLARAREIFEAID